jgi:hypothetical protein
MARKRAPDTFISNTWHRKNYTSSINRNCFLQNDFFQNLHLLPKYRVGTGLTANAYAKLFILARRTFLLKKLSHFKAFRAISSEL